MQLNSFKEVAILGDILSIYQQKWILIKNVLNKIKLVLFILLKKEMEQWYI